MQAHHVSLCCSYFDCLYDIHPARDQTHLYLLLPGNSRPLTPMSLPGDDAEALSYPTTPSSSFQNGLNRPSMQVPLRAGSEMSAPVSDDIEVRRWRLP